MDPDAALVVIRERIAQLKVDRRDPHPADVSMLVEEFEGLDQWLSQGGFIPLAWASTIKEG